MYERTEQHYDNDLSPHYDVIRHRAHPIEVTDIDVNLAKLDYAFMSAATQSIIERYERAEIDGVYLVYNEFKSVIAQRVVVEKLLPIRKLGSQEITAAEVMTEEQRDAAAHAAQSSGISLQQPEDLSSTPRRKTSAPPTSTTSSTRIRRSSSGT